MDKRERGDRAIIVFSGELDSINDSGERIMDRIIKIDNAYRKAAGPWMLEGEDRVLDKMRTEASSAVEKAISSEVCAIKTDTKRTPNAKVLTIKESSSNHLNFQMLT